VLPAPLKTYVWILPGRVECSIKEAGEPPEKGSTTGPNWSGLFTGLRLTHPIKQGRKDVPWALHFLLQSSTESSRSSMER